jgi:hypothetical protein
MTRVLSPRSLCCPETGKRAYVNEAAATAAIGKAWTTKAWRPDHHRMPKRAYLCDICGWWHMTAKRDNW